MSKMAKLKLGAISDDKPIKITLELPASVHCGFRSMSPRIPR